MELGRSKRNGVYINFCSNNHTLYGHDSMCVWKPYVCRTPGIFLLVILNIFHIFRTLWKYKCHQHNAYIQYICATWIYEFSKIFKISIKKSFDVDRVSEKSLWHMKRKSSKPMAFRACFIWFGDKHARTSISWTFHENAMHNMLKSHQK